MARRDRRQRIRNIRDGERYLEQAEHNGLVRWTGKWLDGLKVYEPTEFGRGWAERALAETDEDTP